MAEDLKPATKPVEPVKDDVKKPDPKKGEADSEEEGGDPEPSQAELDDIKLGVNRSVSAGSGATYKTR